MISREGIQIRLFVKTLASKSAKEKEDKHTVIFIKSDIRKYVNMPLNSPKKIKEKILKGTLQAMYNHMLLCSATGT